MRTCALAALRPGGREHEPADQLGTQQGELLGDLAAQGVAEQVDAGQAERVGEGDGVAGRAARVGHEVEHRGGVGRETRRGPGQAQQGVVLLRHEGVDIDQGLHLARCGIAELCRPLQRRRRRGRASAQRPLRGNLEISSHLLVGPVSAAARCQVLRSGSAAWVSASARWAACRTEIAAAW